MARVTHVKKARKDVPGTDIKAGESYYWWKFRRGGKRFSKTPPRRSQLTQSSFYSSIYDLEDDTIAKATADSSLRDIRDEVVNRLREISEECQSSLDNMPEGLQQGDTGQLLQSRIDAMDSAADEFEQIELDEDFEATKGVEVETEGEHIDEDGKCKECGEDERHTIACSHAGPDGERVNDDDKTEDDFWQEKLEEFQNVSIEAP